MNARRVVAVEGQNLVSAAEPSWEALGRYGRANIAVVIAQAGAWTSLLTAIDASSLRWEIRALAVVVFCLLMQGVFTMLHEFCHRNAHRELRWNYAIGWVASTLFGTAPALLQVQHWGHHRRNRTEAERGEFIHDGETRLAKTVNYYVAIFGGIWLGCAVVALLAPLLPYRVLRLLSRTRRFNTFAAGFADFSARDWRRLRIEGIVFAASWAAIIAFGPWSATSIAIAYAAFAFTWSSLQWIYHMHTPVHVVEGAYNLRAPFVVRILFLNFNYNLTHHRRPSLPWQELRAHSDPKETQPIWYRYLLVFRPPVPFPANLSALEKRYF